jgi:hypothetical protein
MLWRVAWATKPTPVFATRQNHYRDFSADHGLSTDTIKTFKPDLRAYQLGIDAINLPKEQIAFAVFADGIQPVLSGSAIAHFGLIEWAPSPRAST